MKTFLLVKKIFPHILLGALLILLILQFRPVHAGASVSEAFSNLPQVSIDATGATLESFHGGFSTFNEVVADISLGALNIATTSFKIASGPVHAVGVSFYTYIYTFIVKHI